ncbi:MAG TPA: EAL domain-containing protein [Solirubrobacteraceae bacterium]|nr:EAL domain-containing protein [Solirubrobacteraceae bacterium]
MNAHGQQETGRLGAPLRRLAKGRTSAWAAVTLALVCVGILAAVLSAQAVERSDAAKAKLAFHLTSAGIASALGLTIQHEEDLVVGASAFVAANPHASAAAFDRWVESVQAMRRYPELQNIGLVRLVPGPRLPAFEANMAADPLRPLNPDAPEAPSRLQLVPTGERPYYCLASAGLARDAASYVPPGLDYCALAPTLLATRESGRASYAPFRDGAQTALGVETPVYGTGTVPATLAARRTAFVGWLGELLTPKVVLAHALGGHPNMAVTFRYDSAYSHVTFTSGSPPAGAQRTTIALHDGWSAQIAGAPVAGGVLGDRNALALLIGGTLLSLLFGLLVFVLGTGRRRALSLVNEKTRALVEQALHDPLTGLPNRALVLDRAEQMLARAARDPELLPGALFVDIDGFKHVNDTLGHAAGDLTLQLIGERLQQAVREQDTVGRLGGDEFVVLVESHADDALVEQLAARLLESLREPIELEDSRRTFSVTVSIGVALGRYATPDDLLRDADLALYAAKKAGRDRCVHFDADMRANMGARLELQSQLSAALRHDELFLLYQPVFDLHRHEVVAAEALIRWRHPERGIVAPGNFILQAEESGLIVPIGRWVLREACRQAAAWAEQGLELVVSVNVSAYQLAGRGFAEEVRRALADAGLAPSSLTLEITETTLMRNLPTARDHLEEIRAMGVRIAIDDFGTGYASLSYLQRMPVDILKIDRSFVTSLERGSQSRALLEAILGVARALALLVVVEGVEDRAQLGALEEMGCAMVQGFLLARPGSAAAVERLLEPHAARRTAPAAA